MKTTKLTTEKEFFDNKFKNMKKVLLSISLVFILSMIAGQSWGQTSGDYRSRGTGDWGTASTWDYYNGTSWDQPSTTYPGQSTGTGLVTIGNGHNINLNVSPVNPLGSLAISNGNANSSIIFSGTNTLTITGGTTITTSNNNGISKYIRVNAGTFNSASLTLTASGGNTRDCYIAISTGSVNITGNVTMNQTNLRSYILFTDNGFLNLGGTISGGGITSNPGGGSNPTSGTVNYNSSGAQTIGNYTYYNLSVSNGGTKSLAANTVVRNNLNIGSSATFDVTTNNRSLTVGGDFTNNGTFTQRSGLVTFNGTAAQAIDGTTATAFNSVTISNTSAAVTANTNFSIANTFTVNANATLSPGSSVIVSGSGTLTGNGTVQVSRTGSATDDFAEQYTISNKTLTNLTVDYSVASGGQKVSATTYGKLKLSNTSGTNTAAGAITVSGVFTSTSGGTLNTAYDITFSGTTACGGSINATAGTVTYGVNAANILAGTYSGLIINRANVSLCGDITVSGNAACGSGTINAISGTITYSGANQNIIAGTYYNLTINQSSGTAVLCGNVTVSNTLTLTAGALSIGSRTLTLNGTIAVTSGTLTGGATSNLSIGGNNTAAMTLPNISGGLLGFTLNKTGTNNNVTLGGALTIGGAATFTDGVLNTDYDVNFNGTATCSSGSINATAGTVTYIGTNQNIIGGTYYNLTISGSGSPNTFTLCNNVTVTNQLTITLGTVILDNYNLSLGATATVVGTPDVTKMVVTNGTGQFIKTFAASASPVSFTFPVGDNTGITQFSPVTLTFASNSGGNIGVNVVDAIHGSINNPTAATDYLTRYWKFSSTIATYNYTGTFTYSPAVSEDIVGTESNMILSIWNATNWTGIAGSSAASNVLTLSTGLTEATGPLNGNDFTGRYTVLPAIAISSFNPAVNAANIFASTVKQPIYNFATAVTLNNAQLNSLAFTTTGTYIATDIDKFQLWYNSVNNLATASQIGLDITTNLQTGLHTFSGLSQSTNTGTSGYFWITVNPAATAINNNNIAVNAIATTDLVYLSGNVTGTTSNGGVQTILQPLITIADNNPQVIASTVNVGVSNVVLNQIQFISSDINVTLSGMTCTTAGTYVVSDFTALKMWISPDATFNAGTALQLSSIVATASGNLQTFTITPQTINAGTTYYIYITTNIALTATSGNNISINAIATTNLTFNTGIKTSTATAGGLQTIAPPIIVLSSPNPAVPTAFIDAASIKQQVYSFTLDVSSGNTTLSSINFTTTNSSASDIIRYQLLYNTNNSFSGATQIASDIVTGLGSGAHSFLGLTQTIISGTTGYFWITVDVASNAVPGNTIVVNAITTADINLNAGNKSGTAYVGGTQTISSPVITLTSPNPSVAIGTVYSGTLKQKIYYFTNTVTRANATINSVTFNSTNVAADVSKFQLWYNTSNNFGAATQLGSDITTSLGTGSHTFSGLSKIISVNSTGYFWITFDVATNATNNNTINVSAITTSNLIYSLGTIGGVAFNGGTQTIKSPGIVLSSPNLSVATGTVNVNTTKQPIYYFTNAISNTTAILNSVTFTTAGSYTAITDISKFQLWFGTNNSLSLATKIGSDITTTLGTGSHTFSSLNQSISAGTTGYFWITIDVPSGATQGNTISANTITTGNLSYSTGVLSGTAYAGGIQTISSPSIVLSSNNPVAIPAASIYKGTLKQQIYAFTNTPSNSYATIKSVTFTTTGTYVADVTKFQLWFSTSNSLGSAIQIGTDITSVLGPGTKTFSGLSQSISNGTTGYFWITTDVAIGATTGRTISVNAITTGNLTYVVGSLSGTAYAGGTQTIADPTNITLASLTPSVATADLYQGMVKQRLSKFITTITGVTATLNTVNFTTTGNGTNNYVSSDISKIQLWYNTVNSLASATLLGTLSTVGTLGPGAHSFTGLSQAITGPAIGYFWITVDMAASPTNNNTIKVSSITTSDLIYSNGAHTKSGMIADGGLQTIVISTDSDVDGVPDIIDLDDDNDGIPDITENSPCNPTPLELFTNGNFSAGNTGFYTPYNYRDPITQAYVSGDWNTGLGPEKTYTVYTSPGTRMHPNFSVFGDHTSGTGNMMIINGSPILNEVVWQQGPISVTPYTNYNVSLWINSAHKDYPAKLIWSINGEDIGKEFNATPDASSTGWRNAQTTWYSGKNTSATFAIINLNTAAGGNDFVLDDISCTYIADCDVDDDGVVDRIDLDTDNDGIYDVVEMGGNADGTGKINSFVDLDKDGLADVVDNVNSGGTTEITSGTPLTIIDSDGNALPDRIESDSDADGCFDVSEAGFLDGDSDGRLGSAPLTINVNGVITGQGGYTTPANADNPGNTVMDYRQKGPAITVQPTDQNVCLDGNPNPTVNFSVSVTGTGNTYQWQKSTDNGATWTNLIDGGTPTYSGVTTPSMSLSGSGTITRAAFDGVMYKVNIYHTAYTCSPIVSSAVTLHVYDFPPATPGTITGLSPVCSALNANYFVLPVDQAASYIWTLPVGWSITSGIGNNSVIVTTGAQIPNVTIAVAASNSCGTSSTSNKSVMVLDPTPSFTSVPNVTECTGSNVTYTTQSGFYNYIWTVPGTEGTDYTIISGGISTVNNTVTLKWLTAGSKTVTVTYQAGGCSGVLATNTTNVNWGTPANPGAISGSISQCGTQTGQVYSITAIDHTTTYNWTVPTGWSITGGSGTNSITVSTGVVGDNGNIQVTAQNSCGTSAASTLAVSVNGSAPGIPGTITGTTSQCAGEINQSYNISAVANATTYTWTVPTGWSITSGQGTTSILVTTGAIGDNGNISVTAGNGCGTSSAKNLAVNVNQKGQWVGSHSSDWFDVNNWSCPEIPIITSTVIIPYPCTNYPVISTSGAVCENLTIDVNASLEITGTNNLDVYGNWINNGTFTASSTSTVSFNGTTTVSGATISAFGNIVLTGELTGHSSNINVKGNWTNTGNFIHNSGTITFNGTTAQTINSVNEEIYNNLTISGTNVSISSTSKETVNGNLIVSGKLTIKSTSLVAPATATTGSLITKGTITKTGTITVERYLKGNRWYFIYPVLDAIPTITYSKEGGYTNYNLYKYVENNADYWNSTTNFGTTGWTGITAPATISPDEGFIYNRYQMGNKTFVQTGGTLFSGDKTFTGITYTPHTLPGTLPTGCINNANYYDGWNLVGNPYPCSIDWDAVVSYAGNNGIEAAVYLYNGTNYEYYIPSGPDNYPFPSLNINTATKYISSGQGFMVKAANPAVTTSFTIPASARVHNGQDALKTSTTITHNVLRMKISKNGITDEAIVRTLPVESGVTDNHDGNYDAYKMFAWDKTMPQIYTANTNFTNIFAINSVPEFDNTKQIPLGIYIGAAGQHTISFTENTFDSMLVFLEDKSTTPSTFVNINATPTYTFTQAVGSNTTRFALNFRQNHAPVTSDAISNQTVNEDELYSFTANVNFIDSDLDDIVTITAEYPHWLSFNPATKTFTGIPDNSNVGIYTIKIIGTDLAKAKAEVSYIIEVINVNDAPLLTSIINEKFVNEDEQSTFVIQNNLFMDIDENDVLTYSLSINNQNVLPSWISFNNQDLTITTSPTNENVGIYYLSLKATDLAGASITAEFILNVKNVNDEPTLNIQPGNLSVLEDINQIFTLLPLTFIDPDLNDVLTYTVDNLPAFLTFNSDNMEFTAMAGNYDVGLYTISIIANDLQNSKSSADFIIEVVNVNDTPILNGSISDKSINQDEQLSFTLPENLFTDIDLNDVLTYSATLTNGNSLPEWLTFNSANKTFYGIPKNEDVSTYNIMLLASDLVGDAVSTEFELKVNNINDAPYVNIQPESQTVLEDLNTVISLSLTTFIDPDLNDVMQYSVNQLPEFISFNSNNLEFTVQADNNNVGIYPISLTAKDLSNVQAIVTFNIEVLNVNDPPILNGTISDSFVNQDEELTINIPENLFMDIDFNDVLTYSATLINGNQLPLWITFNADNMTLSGIPSNEDVGTNIIRLQVSDLAGEVVYTDFALYVLNVNDAPIVVNEPNNKTVLEDAYSVFAIPASTFSDPDLNDVLIYSVSQLPSWITFNSGNLEFTAQPRNNNVGFYVITLTATDLSGRNVSTDFILTVENTNDAPYLINEISDIELYTNDLITVEFGQTVFADIDYNDNLTYDLTLANDTDLPEWLTFDIETNTLTAMPLTGDEGIYEIKVTATDNSDAIASTLFRVDVKTLTDIILTDKGSISVYPNPSTGIFKVKTSEQIQGADYKLFDITGKQIKTGKITDKILVLDLTENSKGAYTLSIISGVNSYSLVLIHR